MPHRALPLLMVLALFGCGDDSDSSDASLDAPSSDASGVQDAESVDGSDSSLDVDSGTDDVGVEDATFTDSGPDAGRSNPSVELIREVTFEQPDGTAGWSDSASVIFNWQEAATGRDRVPDAFVRLTGGINIPDVVSDVAYRGSRSVRMTMKPWSSASSFRTDLELAGDINADPPIERRLFPGEVHLVGFAMRIEHTTVPSSGFQLYHQYHNNSPAREGYGTTNNPAVSLLRLNNDDMSVAIRDNRPGNERLSETETIVGGVRPGQWVRWVFKTRFANFDSGESGLVEVYSAVGNEPLTMHFRVDDRPVGYVYEDPDDYYELCVIDMYGSPLQEDAAVYFDEYRIAEGDLDPSVVDPISWVSYQHPLNQPYDADLSD